MAQARYSIRTYSPVNGEQTGSITNWQALNYEKHVNNFHNMQLVLDAQDPAIRLFDGLDTITEVWRKIEGLPWYQELVTVFRTSQYNLYENGRETFTGYFRGLNDFLHRRAVAYPANTPFTLKSGPADDVMKAFVRENALTAHISGTRKSAGVFDATIYGLTVTPDLSLAPEWSGGKTWLHLLDVLEDIASPPSNVDFEIVRVGNTGLNFEFNTYYPQRGTNRVGPPIFGPHLGNILNVVFTRSRTEEANVVYVLGDGEGAARRVVVRKADDFVLTASRWNTIETTTDARSQSSIAAFNSQGDEILEKLKAQNRFEFEAIQTSQHRYGQEYVVGDIVSATYKNFVTIKKIITATVSVKDGKEDIKFDFSDHVA